MPRKKSIKEIRRRHRATDFKDVKAEIEICAGILKNKEIMEVISNRLDSQAITSEKLKWIYDKAVDIYKYENELMSTRTFKHTLDVKESKRKIYLSFWRKIQKTKKSVTMASSMACYKKLMKYYRARTMSIGVADTIKSLQKAHDGDLSALDEAQTCITIMNDLTAVEEFGVANVTDPVQDYGLYKEEFKRIQKDPSSVMGIETGVTEIDKQMLGLRKGELGVVCGPTAGGKSIMIMNFGTHAWKTAGDVAIFTIEMSEQQYKSRWYCHMSGIDYEKFRKYTITKKEWNILDRTVETAKKNKNTFKIIDMPQGCNAENLRKEISKLRRSYDLQMCVIDYMNIMTGPSGKVDFSWPNQLEIAVQLKLGIARGMDLPVWTACQTDGKDDVGFSKHIKDQLDVGGLLVHDEHSKETGIVFWKWVKARDFKGEKIQLETDMGHMRMTPLPASLQKQIKKMKKFKKKGIRT
jgi:replicative DNA helicase